MQPKWDDNQPIYRQLKDRVLDMILEGDLTDGDALPSVRTVAAEYQLNPLTVLKSYQALVDEGIVEKRRGKGMYVPEGARDRLLARERRRFIEEEWPRMLAKLSRLGLEIEDLPGPPQERKESRSE